MSVTIRAETPASSNRFATVRASRPESSSQPCTATLPFRTSTLTAICSGQLRAAVLTRSGSRTAAVPRITRLTPASIQASTLARVRMPPPNCTGIETALRIASTAAPFTARPWAEPFRSTTCSQLKPALTNCSAWSAGEVLNTVASFMSPRSSRTQWPSFRSMAGKRITGATPGSWRAASGPRFGIFRGGTERPRYCPWPPPRESVRHGWRRRRPRPRLQGRRRRSG